MPADTPESTLRAALRELPSVDHLLNQPAVATLLDEFPRTELVQAVRELLDDCRNAIRAGQPTVTDVPRLALRLRGKLHERARPSLRRVVNATGVVLHTNLGRAPLAQEAVEAIADVAGGYSSLEFELETGVRGDRQIHARRLLGELTGAEDGLVVNNNAAATFLTLHALAAGRSVIVSRGQLVEIGGSYRLPDIMAAAGCTMVEVGTTNRTHLRDYERAIGPDTAMLLRVHTSNFRLYGFTTAPSIGELVALARRHRLLVVDDLGSGLLPPTDSGPGGMTDEGEPTSGGPTSGRSNTDLVEPLGPETWDEPAVRDSIAAGADVVLFSGDKLLGGPQAGVILGRTELLAAMRQDPLMRTFRPDKMTLAGLEATLRLYRDPEHVAQRVPALRLLLRDSGELCTEAEQLRDQLAAALPDVPAEVAQDHAFAGGGALPTVRFPTWTVRVRIAGISASAASAALRKRDVPVICRVQQEALVFDCRTLLAGDDEEIVRAVADLAHDARK